MDPYLCFLEKKKRRLAPQSHEVGELEIHPKLFDYQRQIVERALSARRFAVFADTGLGKTYIEIEFARHVPGKVLMCTPPSVGPQVAAMATDLGFPAHVSRDGEFPANCRLVITNYHNIHKFNIQEFQGFILDESSILKNFSSKFRKILTDLSVDVPFVLCATATPSPNDLIEILNHAVFLHIRTWMELQALFFVTDESRSSKFRLKKHAVNHFWQWMNTWSVALRKPSDIGGDDSNYILPELEYIETVVPTDYKMPGNLFTLEAEGLREQRAAARGTLSERAAKVSSIVNSSKDQFIVWCNLNCESKKLAESIPGSVEIAGRHTPDQKSMAISRFLSGHVRVIVSKPKIFGMGLNLQNCHRQVFMGLSHSFEQMYQAVRRSYRFGQKNNVTIDIVTADVEGSILANIKEKERKHHKMMDELIKRYAERADFRYAPVGDSEVVEGDKWQMHNGDCVMVMRELPSESVDLTVFSPPFPAMYAYTDSESDVGNCDDLDLTIEHLRFAMIELLRLLKPGRVACVHLMQPTIKKNTDGYIGRRDFRGKYIEMAQEVGWIYASEILIDKNPQYKAIRTKERGLLFMNLAKDSSVMAPAVADYVLIFKKKGKNETPIHAGESGKYNPGGGWITQEEWIEWASPVWYRQFPGSPMKGIMEGDVLNVRAAREPDDERHLCPLQLGVIERCVKLYSNPGETVFSPFAGVGSEGYRALELGRSFFGIELKRSYFDQAVVNLRRAVGNRWNQPEMFSEADTAQEHVSELT